MTSFSAEQGKFPLTFPRLSISKAEGASIDLTLQDNTVVDMYTADDSDPNNLTLSSARFTATTCTPLAVEVSFNQWKKALDFIKEPAVAKMGELKTVFPNLPYVSPATNPEVNAKLTSPFINVHFQMSFKPHDVLRVWMTRSMRKELISPTIQMVEISPLVRICVQHNTHPAECFSDQNLSNASRKFYSDISEYVHLWEKVLLAEAAEKSVKDSKQVIIHDVQLEWPCLSVPSNCIDEEYYQPNDSIVLALPEKYVESCSEFIKFNVGDLVCVRYGTDPNSEVRAVFHMVIHKIQHDEDNDSQPCKLWMKFVGEHNCKISEEMRMVLKNKCELQLISLSSSYQ